MLKRSLVQLLLCSQSIRAYVITTWMLGQQFCAAYINRCIRCQATWQWCVYTILSLTTCADNVNAFAMRILAACVQPTVWWCRKVCSVWSYLWHSCIFPSCIKNHPGVLPFPLLWLMDFTTVCTILRFSAIAALPIRMRLWRYRNLTLTFWHWHWHFCILSHTDLIAVYWCKWLFLLLQGSSVAITVFYPLDVARTRLQGSVCIQVQLCRVTCIEVVEPLLHCYIFCYRVFQTFWG